MFARAKPTYQNYPKQHWKTQKILECSRLTTSTAWPMRTATSIRSYPHRMTALCKLESAYLAGMDCWSAVATRERMAKPCKKTWCNPLWAILVMNNGVLCIMYCQRPAAVGCGYCWSLVICANLCKTHLLRNLPNLKAASTSQPMSRCWCQHLQKSETLNINAHKQTLSIYSPDFNKTEKTT